MWPYPRIDPLAFEEASDKASVQANSVQPLLLSAIRGFQETMVIYIMGLQHRYHANGKQCACDICCPRVIDVLHLFIEIY